MPFERGIENGADEGGRVGLTGGVFQNRLLSERAEAGLRAAGFSVMLPLRLPGNDGGLSFGQIIEAMTGDHRRRGDG